MCILTLFLCILFQPLSAIQHKALREAERAYTRMRKILCRIGFTLIYCGPLYLLIIEEGRTSTRTGTHYEVRGGNGGSPYEYEYRAVP